LREHRHTCKKREGDSGAKIYCLSFQQPETPPAVRVFEKGNLKKKTGNWHLGTEAGQVNQRKSMPTGTQRIKSAEDSKECKKPNAGGREGTCLPDRGEKKIPAEGLSPRPARKHTEENAII